MTQFIKDANELSTRIFTGNQEKGWWTDLASGRSTVLTRNRPEIMMLIVSELVEAQEGAAKNLQDDKLPHRKMAEVELADVAIRLYDLFGAEGIVLTEAPDFEFDVDNFPGRITKTFDEHLMWITCAIGNAMEGHRKGKRDVYVENLQMALFRTYWVAGLFDYDIIGAIDEKIGYNAIREDHKVENRIKDGGKAY